MIIKKIDFIFDIVFSILLFSLSVSMAAPNILLGLLILVFIFKKQREIVLNTYTKLVSIFVLYLVLKALFFNALIENLNIYKFLFIILILSFLMFGIKNVTLVIKGYVFGVFTGVLISFTKVLLYFSEHKVLPFGNSAEVQNLILIHRPYFGFMCLLAVILIDYLFIKTSLKNKKMLYLVIAILITAFLYTIVARLSLLLLCIYIVIRVFIYLKRSKTRLIIGLIVFTITVFGAFNLNKNLKNRLHIKESYTETIKVLKNQEPRFVLWNCVFDQFKDKDFNVFFGYNNRYHIQNKLNECYDKNINNISKRNYYLMIKFNTHNQFFDIFLDGGGVGLILFILILGFSAYSFRNNIYAIFSIISILLFFLVENLFHRQLGAYLIGIFIPLIYKMFVLEKNEEKKNHISY